MSELQIIIGPTFSGKTTELLKRCKKYNMCRYKCILLKHQQSTKYDIYNVITHDRIFLNLKTISSMSIAECYQLLLEYDVIGIDEGHLFNDIHNILGLLNYSKIIIISSLDISYKLVPFIHILNLIPYCESVVKLNSICMKCYENRGIFTKYINESYITLCRKCYY